jgi:RNA polymerase sigma-54 factor
MALNARLEIRQSHQLVMTPQLQQAIKLLQLSNLELAEFVAAEIERNPLLESEDADGEPAPAEAAPSITSDESPAELTNEWSVTDGRESFGGDDDVGGDGVELAILSTSASDPTDALDTAYENVYPDSDSNEMMIGGDPGWSTLRTSAGAATGETPNAEEYVSGGAPTLKAHLESQLSMAPLDPAERLVAHYLIDLVDETGYLRDIPDDLADRLGAGEELIARVLATLQRFEPAGVFARSLQECLALQLKDRNRYDPRIGALIDNLPLLASHNLTALRRVCGCDAEELAEMIAELRTLNAKPGLAFGSEPVQPVVPDVLVRPRSDGGWQVELNSETLPRVLVNHSYFAIVSKASKSASDKTYINECMQTANWLVKSLDQRARTILRVSEEIVRQQDGFFAHGVQHLRPLNLRTVADAISMHESTVSRVTSNKYIATNRGVFELKYFFTSAIAAADDGEAHSSESVRFRIKQLIDAEDAEDVLSDDKLVERLKEGGIDIARRTVAKYREAMRIPSSVQRRREKRLSGSIAKVA